MITALIAALAVALSSGAATTSTTVPNVNPGSPPVPCGSQPLCS